MDGRPLAPCDAKPKATGDAMELPRRRFLQLAASAAALPGAQVLMTETDKGVTRTTSTDATGHYALPNLPVGPYRLEVKLPGFKDYVQTGIVLVVNNNIKLNVTMQVGAVSETVEVSAAANQVETKETSVASVIDQQRISELPLNNRQPTQLIIALGASVYADSSSRSWHSSPVHRPENAKG